VCKRAGEREYSRDLPVFDFFVVPASSAREITRETQIYAGI
jgi:hypothetical protein